MKKILGSIKKSKDGAGDTRSNGFRNSMVVPTGDGPEAIVYREVGAFCESGAPGSGTTGDEYLHLPAIVDAAESSPSAANQAAIRIRGYLSKDHYGRGFAQYNAIMLLRILTDNPGRVFTQNFDKEFISTVKKLLRDGRDSSVQQILRETLDYFEIKSNENDSLKPLIDMWKKEKGAGAAITTVYPRGSVNRAPPMPPRPRGLPPPDELAGRIEEAKTTARLLVQTVQSTPMVELLQNDLVKEFAERARVAQKSIQGYMNAENPHPDDDTMLTLIETAEQLNVAMTKHQRAVLQARKATGVATPSPQPDNRTQYMGMTSAGNTSNQPQQQRDSYNPYSGEQYMTGGENVYGQPIQPPLQPQRFSQPPRQDQQPMLSPPIPNGQGRTSPRNEQFVAPPGPPPGRPNNTVYSDYQTQPIKTPTATANYEVADNPFSDAATYEQPQQNHYSLFGRSNQQPQRTGPTDQTNAYGQPVNDNPYSQPPGPPPSMQPPSGPPPSSQRPGAYQPGFVPTQSYMHRQDSAAQHITMHGASPPAESQR